MAGPNAKAIVFVVPGWDEGAAATERGAGSATAEASALASVPGKVKHSVRLGTSRGGAVPVKVAAVPGDDVVVLEIVNGPSLVLHPETARDLMLAQSDVSRSAAPRAEGVSVPMRLQWRGLESTIATRGATRGFLGDVVLKAIHVVTGLVKDPAADFVASKIVRNFDGRVTEGVYQLHPDKLPALKDSGSLVASIDPVSSEKASLVLVHGTFSSTDGTFSKLWTEHPDLVQQLFKNYDDRVYALDHRTLGVSPITNALTLARALPDGGRVHLLTHSRGGLVAEVFARVCSDPDADLSAFSDRRLSQQLDDLRELVSLVKRKRLRADRVVRVACPARGTLLASKRLDAYLSVVKWSLSLAGIPVVPELVSLLGEVARRRADPSVLPGLAAQIPDSPLVRWLHAAERPIAGELRVVAGDMEGDSVTSWLKTLMADAFFWTDNDLVVQTRSMYGGPPRDSVASFVLDQGGTVSHFGYFSNERTARAVLDGLVATTPRDFRTIGPLSAAGQSSTGVRAARRAARAAVAEHKGDRPAVVVLPGIVGSNLRIGRDRVWPGWRVVNGLERLQYGARASVEPDGAIEPLYQELMEHLENTHDVIEFAFDWRLPLEQEAGRLADVVRAALDARKDSDQPVRMLAHSMGGLLARTMWLERPDVWRRMLAHDGARLLMLGTPNAGSWSPMQVLSGDDTLGNMLTIAGEPFREHEVRTLIAGFPGFIQLQASLCEKDRGLDKSRTWEQLAREDVARVEQRSWWHALEIQREAYAWGVPTQAVLDKAVALRKRLDTQIEKELPAFASKLALVVGKAPFTPDGYELVDEGVVYLDVDQAGDGRVTLDSASLPGVRTWRVDCDHGSLPQYRDAFDGYAELLATGSTKLLDEVPAAALRGATVTHVRSRPSRSRVSTRPPEDAADILHRDERRTMEDVPARGTPLRVTILNGDLTFLQQPLLLGHYRSLKLTGTERVMDGLLDHDMDRALRIGLYPVDPGSSKVFINRHVDPQNPWRVPRPQAVVIVGLGPEGELRASQLVNTVRQGVIAWAERALDLPDGRRSLELAATLIGSGGAGISAGQSAQLVAQGVWEANRQLAESEWPQFEHLWLVELYLDRATEAWRALQLQAAAAPGRFVVDGQVQPGTGSLSRPLDADYRGAEYDFMSVSSQEQTKTETGISYRLDTKRARTEVRGQSLQGKLVRELVARASNDRSTDVQIRRTLFQLLVPLELEPFLAGTMDMVIEVDSGTAGIPWEILDTVSTDNGDSRPWALRSKLLRKLRTETFRAGPVDADAEASILVIGEPECDPDMYPRLPGARREATAVASCLSSALQATSGKVKSLISPDDPDQFGPDARTVIDALYERPWRIVHLSGHGEPPGDDGNPKGVVLSSGTFLGPHEIKSMRVVPELVFVNCCHLAARDPDQLLSTKAPPDRAQFAANVAESLIRIGVRCVVAAGWAVDDDAASVFATTFYGGLARGLRFIDAVDDARTAAFEKGGNTWAAYQCYGDPDWQMRREVQDAQRPSEPIREAFASIASPSELRLALEQLVVQSRFGGKKTAEQRPKLENLEARFGNKWGDAGTVAEGFGAAWQAIGDAPRALGWYERAAAANDGSASIKTVEQLANLRVRIAWSSVESANAARASKNGKSGKSRITHAVGAARKEIREALTALERLVALNPSLERESLCGSAYKRLAMIEAIAGDHAAESKAIDGMMAHYQRAETLGKDQQRSDFFYPAMNRIAAALIADGRRGARLTVDGDSVEAIRHSLSTKVSEDPDFWSLVGQTELVVYESIGNRMLAQKLPAILDAYNDVHARVPETWMWASVYDQAWLVLRSYALRAPANEKRAAKRLLNYLLALRDGHKPKRLPTVTH